MDEARAGESEVGVEAPAAEASPTATAPGATALDQAPVDPPAPDVVEEGLPASADVADDGGTDTAFSADLGPDVRDFGQTRPQATVCPWCGAPLTDPSVDACPSCGTRLKPVQDDLDVPGLTTVSPEARAAQARVEIARLREAAKRGEVVPGGGATAGLSEPALPPTPPPVLAESEIEAAIQPPDLAVRRLMLEMEVEARRAALERDLPPTEIETPPAATGAPMTEDGLADTGASDGGTAAGGV